MIENKDFQSYSGQAELVWGIAQRRLLDHNIPCDYLTSRSLPKQRFGYLPFDQETIDQIRSLISVELFTRMEKVLFGRLLFDFRAPDDSLLGLGSRACGMGDDTTKYRYHSVWEGLPTKTLVYGLEWVPRSHSKSIIVVEGVTSDLRLQYSMPGLAVVATMGARLILEQASVITSLSNQIRLFFDSDKAGFGSVDGTGRWPQGGMLEALFTFAKFMTVPSVVVGPPGEDPFDMVDRKSRITVMPAAKFIKDVFGDKVLVEYLRGLTPAGEEQAWRVS